jgi:hypothetical protein
MIMNGCCSAPGALTFQCNICGADCEFQLDHLGRETLSCPGCKSTPRVRAINDILARHVIWRSVPLPQFPLICDSVGSA